MSNKDCTLDEPIIKAAWHEFMELGYLKASMRNIASRAGITTGALYRRYKGKKEMFFSLIKGMLEDGPNSEAKEIQNLYIEAFKNKDSDLFIKALTKEEKIYVDLLFKHYDECYLIMIKGEGSDILNDINNAYINKTKETIEFFTKDRNLSINKDTLELILNMQRNMYREIICRGYTKDKAVEAIKEFENFMLPSWKHLFEEMI